MNQPETALFPDFLFLLHQTSVVEIYRMVKKLTMKSILLVLHRFELFILGDGEKKIEEKIFSSMLLLLPLFPPLACLKVINISPYLPSSCISHT